MVTKKKTGSKDKASKRRGRPPKKKAAKEALEKKEEKKKIEEPEKKGKKPEEKKKSRFLYAVGRRKEANARVRFYPAGEGKILINQKPLDVYFPNFQIQNIVIEPFKKVGTTPKGDFSIRVRGGGKRGQAESIRLGISRILINIDESFRPILKKAGLLRRDDRVKERKKYGLKRARRAPQWQKR